MKKLLLTGLLIFSALIFSGCNPLEWKQQAGLQVITQEINSSLFLDDQYLDKTPYINKKIKPGNYTLRIQPDDSSLVPYDIPITLNKGTITVVEWKPNISLETSGGIIYEMEKTKGTNLDFQTIPNSAILTFDEGVKQFSPLSLVDIAEGNHTFEISLPSYETQQRAVNVIKDHHISLTIILAKELAEPKQEEVVEVPEATEGSSLLNQEINGDGVQILNTGFFVKDEEVLRVRKEPSTAGAELGFAKVGKTYPYKEEVAGWLGIEFEGQVGWVSNQFSQKISAKSAE